MQANVSSRMKWILCSASFAIALLASARVEAAELNTAVLRSNADLDVDYKCQFTNLGTQTVAVTLTLINTVGAVENTPVEVNVGPNSTVQSTVFGDDAAGAFCRASGKFSRKKVAMTLQLVSATLGTAGITQVSVPGQ